MDDHADAAADLVGLRMLEGQHRAVAVHQAGRALVPGIGDKPGIVHDVASGEPLGERLRVALRHFQAHGQRA